MLCVCACATERGGRESEGTQAARRCGNGKRRERVACEGKPARSGGDDVDDGRIIHSAAQKKGEERVLCVCVCVRDREEAGSLGTRQSERSADWHRYSGALRTQKVRRGPERVVAEEYGSAETRKSGGGEVQETAKRDRQSDEPQVNNTTCAVFFKWCATHSRKCAAGRMKRRGR